MKIKSISNNGESYTVEMDDGDWFKRYSQDEWEYLYLTGWGSIPYSISSLQLEELFQEFDE